VKHLLSMEVKLAQQTLMDGVTTIEAEEFAPDYSVGIVTPDGVIPMPVGEYTTANGEVIVVETEGIIASIAPAMEEAPAPEVPTEAAATAKKVVETVSKETFFAMVEKTTELQAEVERLKVELASNAPAAAPISHNPENVVEKQNFQIGAKRERTTEDVVFAKLFKK